MSMRREGVLRQTKSIVSVRTVVSVRHAYQPNRLSCTISKSSGSSSLPKGASSEPKTEPCSKIIEENVRKRAGKVPRDKENPSHHCRVCQPEVTPTRCSKDPRSKGQGNFWRCTRHQPGASYRLEAAKNCEETAGSSTVVQPENTTVNDKSGMVQKYLKGWREKSENHIPETSHRDENGENLSETNLVCCLCNCPYLKRAAFSDYEAYRFQKPEVNPSGEMCTCAREMFKREGKQEDVKESRKQRAEREKHRSIDGTKHLELPESSRFAGKGRSQYSEQIPEVSQKPARNRSDETIECPQPIFRAQSESQFAKGQPAFPVVVEDCWIREFAKYVYVSPESGANADVSDDSIRANLEMDLSSVTSSTFIHLMREKPNDSVLDRLRHRACNPRVATARTYVESLGQKSQRRKRCIANNKLPMQQQTFETRPGTQVFSEPRRGKEFNVGPKRVTSKVTCYPQLEEHASPSKFPNESSSGESSASQISETYEKFGSYHDQGRACSAQSLRDNFFSDDSGRKNVMRRDVDRLSTVEEDHNSQDDEVKRRLTDRTESVRGPVENASEKWTKTQSNSRRSKKNYRTMVSEQNRERMIGKESSHGASHGADIMVELLPGLCAQPKSPLSNTPAIEACTDTDCSDVLHHDAYRNARNYENDVRNEFVEPFVKETCDENNENGTDDPEIETFDQPDKMASSCAQNGRYSPPTTFTVRNNNTPVDGFFSTDEVNGVPNCYPEMCAELKSRQNALDEELFVQSCSESEPDNLEN